ncbi:MAG: flagellar regulator YcgR PilZN domain-containing protein, partial [Myxococcota bacterium]
MPIEEITSADRVKRWFSQLEQERSRLELTFEGQQSSAASTLLAAVFEPKRAELILDELIPLPLNKLLPSAKTISVRAVIDGGELRFSTQYLRSLVHDRVQAHALALPKVLHIHQLREYFRVPAAGVKCNIAFLLVNGDTERAVAEGQLFDISKGGVAVDFKEVAPQVTALLQRAPTQPEDGTSTKEGEGEMEAEDELLIRMHFSDKDLVESTGRRDESGVFRLPVIARS